ncbi:hypothetical protein K9L16_02635 [Candidatus Pacearchaeota archaeon]|nr:hypothetical protein [Candidatus Pacearchaeota archaeon]
MVVNFLFNKPFFSFQEYLFLHFTIIGILVTLIAITTSLTKEIRQDLIWKYYLTSKIVLVYYGFIILSFFITIFSYLFDVWELSNIIFILAVLSFIAMVFFIPYFLYMLKREWLYKRIVEEFRNEIK